MDKGLSVPKHQTVLCKETEKETTHSVSKSPEMIESLGEVNSGKSEALKSTSKVF